MIIEKKEEPCGIPGCLAMGHAGPCQDPAIRAADLVARTNALLDAIDAARSARGTRDADVAAKVLARLLGW